MKFSFFYTSQKKSQIKILLSDLSELFPASKINFDLSDCDKVLRVEDNDIKTLKIMAIVQDHGFTCEVLD